MRAQETGGFQRFAGDRRIGDGAAALQRGQVRRQHVEAGRVQGRRGAIGLLQRGHVAQPRIRQAGPGSAGRR